MEKKEALRRIAVIIAQVKVTDGIEGKAGLKIKLSKLYDMVNIYAPCLNYYDLCVKEAEMIFAFKMKEIKNKL